MLGPRAAAERLRGVAHDAEAEPRALHLGDRLVGAEEALEEAIALLRRDAAAEAMRQVRENAHAAGIDLRIASDLPDTEVSAAGVELCLANYLSNAIKYTNPASAERWAEVSAATEKSPTGVSELVIRVRDNGLGVPPDKREHLFERFFRAHETITEVEGTGLGLSIVRDTAQSLGGRAWAEHPEVGSVFAFSLPDRRTRDQRADVKAASPG